MPFTTLTRCEAVLLVAGEDFRYTLGGEDIVHWAPTLLDGLSPAAAAAPRWSSGGRPGTAVQPWRPIDGSTPSAS